MAIDKTKFDPQGFYGGMAESRALLVKRDDLKWTERFQAPERPVDALLAFGCAVQNTPHLMLEATRVFDLFGIDYVAVTGKQFCCGRPLQKTIGYEAGDRVSSKSYERFMAYRPNVAVQWCGACMRQYLERISAQTDAPFDVVHVTEYLATLLRERGDDVPWRKEVNAKVLLHTHTEAPPQQDKDMARILEILEMIPGVEYVGPVEPPAAANPCDDLGPPTFAPYLNTLSPEVFRRAQYELEDQAAAAGADTIVTPYHNCQLEWSKLSSRTLAVREWMSLLAEALGVGVEDRFSTYWHIGDPERILQKSRPQWESWGLTEAEAREAVRNHFVPEHAVNLPHCDCGGAGCGSPLARLRTAQ